MTIQAEELIAGSELTTELEIPADLLDGNAPDAHVTVRPLTVRDLQLITKAAKDDTELAAGLMIQRALVDPSLSNEDIGRLPAGVAAFLVARINELSGMATTRDELAEVVQAPLARACFVLSKEFGWTPEDVSGMTIGQILLYLEMSRGEGV